ncbi:BAG family molecular chaperone regulator 1-like [Dysidea avara]|uniref:BAG family molecular chaperone regulator 1-like n=1 Tax=Dysidea avara TaxID=196820 RepID=UPI0033219773
MTVELRHGSERHHITLPSEVLLGREPTLIDLLELVVNSTGITRDCVKMIFKGKTLPHDHTPLKVAGVTDGSRIMLLGKKHNPDDDPVVMAIRQVEVTVDTTNQQVLSLKEEVEGVTKGFLPAHLVSSAVKSHSKQCSLLTERLTQLMEQLDGIQLSESSNVPVARERRKSCIQRIQGLLSILDSTATNLSSQLSQ